MNRLEKIEERLKVDPDDIFLNYSYAMELSKGIDVEATRAAFSKVRQLDSNYVSAYFQEGQFLAGQELLNEAREILREGITVAKRIGDGHALGEITEFLDNL
ncbi:hypothetical protein SH668x_001087 [Planctomicrobium sp. SH668]|uniref:hypothetical protein n=1 Tax=Planctomicrobium sp. SH668 TaxID=3448126 RepID=UPI003F5AF7CA